MIHPGLASVTFRRRPPREIAALAAECGLRGIEWDGDIHVPPGDYRVCIPARRAALRLNSLVFEEYLEDKLPNWDKDYRNLLWPLPAGGTRSASVR